MKRIKIILTTFLFILPLLSTKNIQAQDQGESTDTTLQTSKGIVAFLSGSTTYIKSMWLEDYDEPPKTETINNSLTLFFDPSSIAMRVEFADKTSRVISFEKSKISSEGTYIETKKVTKKAQPPMYFDNNGFVYTSSKSQGYIKIPFQKLSKLMPSQGFLSGINGLPGIVYPDGSVTYYGMDVSPKKFPVLEWAFVYKQEIFEGNAQFTKDTISSFIDPLCVQYKLNSGDAAGSYVLFDSKKRLIEIFTKGSGFIIYIYQNVSVELPSAKDMSAYF